MSSNRTDLESLDLGIDTTGQTSDILNRYEDTTIPSTTSTNTRNYKCPNCGGEFNHWATRHYRYDSDGNKQLTIGRSGAEEKQCPFCGLTKFKYTDGEDG